MTFPQLETGALAQCPLKKRRVARTVRTETPSGATIARADAGSQWYEWELHLGVLTRAERDALDNFVQATEGRLREFVFIDPLGNLLCWSEDFTQAVWTKEPQIQVIGRQITNAGQASQRVYQVATVPGSYCYTAAVSVSTAQPTPVTVFFADDASRVSESTIVSGDPQVISVSGSLHSTANQVRFGFELPPGASVHLDWMAGVAQPGFGTYQRTYDRGGVYTRTRMAQDELAWTVQGPDFYSTTLKLTAWAG